MDCAHHILTAFKAVEGLAYVVQYKTVVALWCETILEVGGPRLRCVVVGSR